ncbi:hypothetical protein PM032_17935 [Halorubrum ezzemoulense]|uniref:hypothetical protein n=1 Tax=Halorubrum ezzemoulense TaxID=337243 RepID=UPI00232C9EC1|nr:hypothetical protein [Halorubrum ezzemoulense]MDB2272847.1 hypothetical protein [Halorubrum ezzemoulense]
MSDNYQVWWIDDQEKHKKAAAELENSHPDLEVSFRTPGKLDDFETSPDLILVDWFLDKETQSNYDKGISVEAKLREMVDSESPIYGFSGEASKRSDEQFTNNRFDYGIFKRSELSSPDSADLLIKDIQSYEKIQTARGEDIQALLDLLDVPEDDYQGVKSVIPREFNDGLPEKGEKPGASLNFARWVRTRFLPTPGPLLNTKWAATQLGIDAEAFGEYSGQFNSVEISENLEYSGVFSHRSEKRYWESQLMRALAKLEKESDVERTIQETWRIGVAVLGVSDEHRAKCVVCRETYPQTVAARKPGEDADLPAHYRHSNVHHSREGAFKDHRVIARSD